MTGLVSRKILLFCTLLFLIGNFCGCACQGDDDNPGPLFVRFEIYFPADSTTGLEYHIFETFPSDSFSVFKPNNTVSPGLDFNIEDTQVILSPGSASDGMVDNLELKTIFLQMPENDVDTLDIFVFNPEPNKCGHIYSKVEKVNYNGVEYVERNGISGSYKFYKQ